jgi:hypothetical protein
MLPSSANDSAAGSISRTLSAETAGQCGSGSVCGIPPKRLPTVATSRCNAQAAKLATATPIRYAGQCGRHRRAAAIDKAATPTACALTVGAALANAASFGTNGPGNVPLTVMPNRSASSPEKMITAMPAVKPTVTGYGMYLTKVPSRSRPTASMITPDISVASRSPLSPWRVKVAATSTMKAPAGPPI